MLLAFSLSILCASDYQVLAQSEDSFPITKTIYDLSQLIGTGPYIASALGITILGAASILGKKMVALFKP